MTRVSARSIRKTRATVLTAAALVLSGLGVVSAGPSAAATSGPGTSALADGQALVANQSIHSPDGRFRLLMQADGNLVLYGPIGALWSSRTPGSPGAFAVLQGDGNLVVYGGSHVAIFATQTRGNDVLTLQSDGNLVIYGAGVAYWATATVQPPPVVPGSSRLNAGQYLTAGNYLSSDDGRFSFAVEPDGDVVLFERGVPLFSTGTTVPGDYLIMQTDGNLVVYGAGRELWSANTFGPNFAVLQADGNFVLYRGLSPVFASGTNQPATGVGVYAGYGTTSQVAAAIGGGWPVVGDAGALGTMTAPYTAEVASQPDLNVAQAIAAAGSPETWLSFWTVSGPVAGDTWSNAGYLAGRQAATTLTSYGARPSFVILDPEGFNGAPTTVTTWSRFLTGWAGGIRSINAKLIPAFYANQYQYQSGGLSAIPLPAFIAVSPVRFSSGSTNQPFVSGNNIQGYIEYYASCPASADEAAVASLGGLYDTVQFPDSAVDCGA